MTINGRERLPRILLADDYADSLAVWAAFLRSSGYDVLTAETGPQALARALQHEPDLVLLDLNLVGMAGVDVARRLRQSTTGRRTPLIAITGFTDARVHLAAERAGFDAVLLKPCNPDELLDRIDRALRVTRHPHGRA